MPLPVWFVSGCGRAHGSAGSAHCVSLCPLPSPGISAGPSSASTFRLPRGTHGCNTAPLPAAGEKAARILSAGTGGYVADAPAASGPCNVWNGPVGVYNPRVGPWEVKAPRSSCSGEDSTPLRGDSGHPVQRNLNTYRKARFFGFPSSWVRLVRQSTPFFPPCGRTRRHHAVAPWPLLALPFWPLRSLPPTPETSGLIVRK